MRNGYIGLGPVIVVKTSNFLGLLPSLTSRSTWSIIKTRSSNGLEKEIPEWVPYWSEVGARTLFSENGFMMPLRRAGLFPKCLLVGCWLSLPRAYDPRSICKDLRGAKRSGWSFGRRYSPPRLAGIHIHSSVMNILGVKPINWVPDLRNAYGATA